MTLTRKASVRPGYAIVALGAWSLLVFVGCGETVTEKKVEAVDASAAEMKQAIEHHTEAATEKIDAEVDQAKDEIRQVAGAKIKAAESAAKEAEAAAEKAEAAAKKARAAAAAAREAASQIAPGR